MEVDVQPWPELVESLSEVVTRFNTVSTTAECFEAITRAATDVVPGCDAASLTFVVDGAPTSRAATDEIASRGDAIQYECGEGPCLDAAMLERWIHTPDLAAGARWPRSSVRISGELGVRSMLSCRLALDSLPGDTLGGLNLYSKVLDGFTDDDLLVTALICSIGGISVAAARENENLRSAIETRQVIGEAIGILRSQNGINSDDAFRLLTGASQRMNVKLRDVAAEIARNKNGTDE